MDEIDFTCSIPVLPSLDIRETQDFYVQQLGCTETVYAEHDYLIVRRNRIEIHFWLTTEPALPEKTSCYIRGGEVPALYEEFKARRVPRLSDFTVREWNMKEFYIHDPHGNLLRFGCAPQEV